MRDMLIGGAITAFFGLAIAQYNHHLKSKADMEERSFTIHRDALVAVNQTLYAALSDKLPLPILLANYALFRKPIQDACDDLVLHPDDKEKLERLKELLWDECKRITQVLSERYIQPHLQSEKLCKPQRVVQWVKHAFSPRDKWRKRLGK